MIYHAGRGAKEANLYTEIAEGIHSYGITGHRHGKCFFSLSHVYVVKKNFHLEFVESFLWCLNFLIHLKLEHVPINTRNQLANGFHFFPLIGFTWVCYVVSSYVYVCTVSLLWTASLYSSLSFLYLFLESMLVFDVFEEL